LATFGSVGDVYVFLFSLDWNGDHGHSLLLLGLLVGVSSLAHGLGHLHRDLREILLEQASPVEAGQHSGRHGEQVEEEEAVYPVADPSHADEGDNGADKVYDGLLLLGLAAAGEGLLDRGEQGDYLGAGDVKLFLLLTGPAVGLEDLQDDVESSG
jgi:hypothetical protein